MILMLLPTDDHFSTFPFHCNTALLVSALIYHFTQHWFQASTVTEGDEHKSQYLKKKKCNIYFGRTLSYIFVLGAL